MFKIEKGVAIPEKNKTGGGKYPFGEMNIGDSFFMEAQSNSDIRKMQISAINNARTWQKRNNISEFKIKTHLYENGIRVWRIK